MCPNLCDLIDGSPPGSPVPGILQARTLEWVAISFSNAWKWKLKVKLFSCIRLPATPWTATYQGPPSMVFSRQEYLPGSGLPLHSLHRALIIYYLSFHPSSNSFFEFFWTPSFYLKWYIWNLLWIIKYVSNLCPKLNLFQSKLIENLAVSLITLCTQFLCPKILTVLNHSIFKVFFLKIILLFFWGFCVCVYYCF